MAVLYSVINAGVREFWVKTAEYDRKFTESETGKRTIPVSLLCTSDQTNLGSDTSGSVTSSATATITFSPEPGTTVTPSSISLSASSSVSGLGGTVGWGISSSGVLVDGPGPVSASYSVTINGSNSGGSIANASISQAVVNIGFGGTGAGGGGNTTVGDASNPDDSDSASGSVELDRFILVPYQAFLNNRYALIKEINQVGAFRPSASGVSPSTPLTISIETSLSVSAAVLSSSESFTTAYDPDDERFIVGAILVFISNASTGYRVFRIESLDGVNITTRKISGEGSMSGSASASIVFSVSSTLYYGLHNADGVIYSAPPVPVNLDDWRRALAVFGEPDTSTLDACLAQNLRRTDSILTSGNLYRIDLGQAISGNTLRDRLQTSPDTVTATLTTRTATSGAACTLGTAVESTVQVPSPGRGTVEGVTYLP